MKISSRSRFSKPWCAPGFLETLPFTPSLRHAVLGNEHSHDTPSTRADMRKSRNVETCFNSDARQIKG
ncbi:hypothetical protein O3P69_006503 [Scylla paramamosain]|uniref:Uncharacterized protein n=1 Tax=Scylla paramamosain TaxID=85552 RepID=A0AAW0U4W4_SCYPA